MVFSTESISVYYKKQNTLPKLTSIVGYFIVKIPMKVVCAVEYLVEFLHSFLKGNLTWIPLFIFPRYFAVVVCRIHLCHFILILSPSFTCLKSTNVTAWRKTLYQINHDISSIQWYSVLVRNISIIFINFTLVSSKTWMI